MENFEIKEPREYNEVLRMLEPTDPDHADTFNALFEQLINNDAFLKKLLEKLKEEATQSEPGLMSAGDKKKLDGIASGAQKIAQADNWKQGTDLPSTYPKGETIFFSNNPANKFNGLSYCTVHTIKGYRDTVPACIQFIYPYNDHADKYYFREAMYNVDSWRSWQEVITSANIGSQAVASATKATQDENGKNITETYFTKTEGDKLKKSVSDGKKLVADAVTAKRIQTATDAAFATIATNISQITTGVDTSDANATAADIASGKVAYVKGQKITGTMMSSDVVFDKSFDLTLPAGETQISFDIGSALDGIMLPMLRRMISYQKKYQLVSCYSQTFNNTGWLIASDWWYIMRNTNGQFGFGTRSSNIINYTWSTFLKNTTPNSDVEPLIIGKTKFSDSNSIDVGEYNLKNLGTIPIAAINFARTTVCTVKVQIKVIIHN